jgi:hypothetical protein
MHTSIARSLFEVLPRSARPGADGRLTVGGYALRREEMSDLLARNLL